MKHDRECHSPSNKSPSNKGKGKGIELTKINFKPGSNALNLKEMFSKKLMELNPELARIEKENLKKQNHVKLEIAIEDNVNESKHA